MIVGFIVVGVLGRVIGAHGHGGRSLAVLQLIFLFVGELIKANLRVAIDVVTPGVRARPAIFAIDLTVSGDMEILLLTLLVTLTPGTVVVDVSADRKRMYIYEMYAGELAASRRRIKTVFEQTILNITR